MPAQVTAVMSNTAHDNAEVEDLSVAICRYDSGALAQITSSVVHHGEEQQLVFQGTRARVSVPWKLKASREKENGFPEENRELEAEITRVYDEVPELSHEGHAGQIEDVLLAVRGEREVLVDGREGRETLELITAIYQAATFGKTVTLPLGKDSPFYTSDGIMKHAPRFYEKKASVDDFGNNEITTGGDYK